MKNQICKKKRSRSFYKKRLKEQENIFKKLDSLQNVLERNVL